MRVPYQTEAKGASLSCLLSNDCKPFATENSSLRRKGGGIARKRACAWEMDKLGEWQSELEVLHERPPRTLISAHDPSSKMDSVQFRVSLVRVLSRDVCHSNENR